MAGLDDEDVTKGYNNFKYMHKLVDDLPKLANCSKLKSVEELKSQINRISDFHKTDFKKHLRDDMEHSCQCLACGFHCTDDPIRCSLRGNHKGPCKDCCDSFTMFDSLHKLLQDARAKQEPQETGEGDQEHSDSDSECSSKLENSESNSECNCDTESGSDAKSGSDDHSTVTADGECNAVCVQ